MKKDLTISDLTFNTIEFSKEYLQSEIGTELNRQLEEFQEANKKMEDEYENE